MEGNLRVYGVLFMGIIAISFAGVFIRLADAPAPVIAFYRMALSVVILFPLILKNRGNIIFSLPSSLKLLSLAAGFFLALHFTFWIRAFEFTTVASAVIFVATQPLFVTIMGYIFLKESVNRWFLLGLGLSILGGLIIGWGDFTLAAPGALWGNFLAVMGAIMAAAYFILGRKVREKAGLLPYIFLVYSTAAFFLLLICLGLGMPLRGYSGETFLFFLLLAIVPTIIGHSSFNWSLKYVPASMVALGILGEPVGATFLAWLILGEKPHYLTFWGGFLILAGIHLAFSRGSSGRIKPA